MIYFLFKTLTVEAESNETYEPSDGLIGAAATIIDVHRSPRRDGPHTLLGFFDLKQLPPELSGEALSKCLTYGNDITTILQPSIPVGLPGVDRGVIKTPQIDEARIPGKSNALIDAAATIEIHPDKTVTDFGDGVKHEREYKEGEKAEDYLPPADKEKSDV